MNAFTLKLDGLGRNDTATGGGKGANLAELAGNGFPVPPAFVVSTEACRFFFSSNGLDRMADAVTRGDPAEIEVRCAAIQKKIMAAEIPGSLSEAILSAYDALKGERTGGPVCAVRSSATSEDLASASFAGQHATYYYVSRDSLLTMVKHCWASLWNPEAALYRANQGIDHAAVWMAVVVQEMILSEISGVTFTANPVSGSAEEIVTESSWGMGAAIVDGRVTPDHYVLQKKGLTFLEKRIGDKRFMVPSRIPEGAETRLQEVPGPLRRQETLSDSLAKRVSRWALKAEAHFGCPQDVEWAVAEGKYYMLQSRPITGIGRRETEADIQGAHVLFKPLFENFTDPLSPLTADCCQFLFSPPLMRLFQGRLYVNLKWLKAMLPLKMSEAQLADFLYGFDGEPPAMKLSPLKLPIFLCLLMAAYLVVGVGFARTRRLPADFMDRYRAFADRIDRDDGEEIQQSLKRLLWWTRIFQPVGDLVLMVNFSSLRYFFYLDLVRKFLRRRMPELGLGAVSALCSGAEGVLSAEMGREIRALAREAAKSAAAMECLRHPDPEAVLERLEHSPESADFFKHLMAFLRKNGHRGLKELELSSQRWEENPGPVLAMIRNYASAQEGHEEPGREAAQARDELRRAVQERLEKFPLEKSTRMRWRMLEYWSERAKYFARMRENSRFYHIMGFYVIRKKIRRIEEALLRQGRLKCRDDIFFLRLEEIEKMRQGRLGWEDVEDRIRERRMTHIRRSRITPPKTIGVGEKGIAADASEAGGHEKGLQGRPASPGRYEGVARVILDASTDMTLKTGEILVAPYTDPAWTPLFLTAGAAVVEVGSYLSHAGTVAREFGMPCVVDLPDCTRRIQTGWRIAVDGDSGRVRVLQGGAAESQ